MYHPKPAPLPTLPTEATNYTLNLTVVSYDVVAYTTIMSVLPLK